MDSLQKKILLVEDEEPMRKALSDALTSEGFITIQAQNGEEGLNLALQQHPDLILLDILMSKMDGIEMMKKLRMDSVGKNTPVILLTNVSPDSNNIINAVSKDQPAYYLVKSDMTLEGIIDKIKEVLKIESNS